MKTDTGALAGWGNAKRARRRQQYRERVAGGRCQRDDPAAVRAWLAAVERDDRADLYIRPGPGLTP